LSTIQHVALANPSALCHDHRADSIGSIQLQFTRVADPDRVLDEVAEREDLRQRLAGPPTDRSRGLPYWAELWTARGGLVNTWFVNMHHWPI